MKKQNFLIFLCFLLMGYVIPSKADTYCTPYGSVHNSGNTYVKSITSEGGSVNLDYQATTMPSFYTHIGEATVQQGGALSIHLVANNLGPYSTTTVYQDLRYNVAYYFVDWNQDGDFGSDEYAPLCGLTSSEGLDNVGGNAKDDFNVLDITHSIAIPENANLGKYRVRVIYTNAWVNRSDLAFKVCSGIMEGVVYDFDINVEAPITGTYTVTVGEAINGTFILKNGEEIITSGDELPGGTEITVIGRPNEGMRLDEIRVNDVVIEGNTFRLTEDVVVSVKFDEFCIINFSAVGNGQVKARIKGVEIPTGSKCEIYTFVEFEVIPDAGYELTSFLLDGSEKKPYVTDNKYEAGSQKDMNVVVTFEKIMHTITIPTVDYGTITVFNGATQVKNGDKVDTGVELTINLTPDKGASLKSFFVNDVDKTEEVVNNRFLLTATTNIVLAAEFDITLYTLSIINDTPEYGTLEVINDATGLPCAHGDRLPKGTNITVVITPKEDYALTHFYENEVEVSDIQEYFIPETKKYEYWPEGLNSDASFKAVFATVSGVKTTKTEVVYYDGELNRLVMPNGAKGIIYSVTGEAIREVTHDSVLTGLNRGCYLAKIATVNGDVILKFVRK